MLRKYKKYVIASVVLLGIKAVLSIYYFQNLDRPILPLQGLTLSESPQKWVDALGDADAGPYLSAALQFSDSGRLESMCKRCTPPSMQPFSFWAPGTPFGLGIIFKVFGNLNMKAIFWFVTVVEALTALCSLWILCFITSNLVAIAVGVLILTSNLPFSVLYYGMSGFWPGVPRAAPLLSSSEPLAILFFALSLLLMLVGLARFWSDEEKDSNRFYLLFAGIGVLIGLSSLVRDSSAQFAYFFAVVFGCSAFYRKRAKWVSALLGAVLLVLCTLAVRWPIEKWNKKRIGSSVVSTSASGAIWHYGIWGDYTGADPVNQSWIVNSGLGFGSYLEPEEGVVVRKAFESPSRGATTQAKIKFAQAVLKHPIKALLFKIQRLPVLFLAMDVFPKVTFSPVSFYCLILYLFLMIHLLRCLSRREWPHEIFYLYPLFLLMASPLIHFEFRYTFPALITLQILPAYEISRWIERYSTRNKSRTNTA